MRPPSLVKNLENKNMAETIWDRRWESINRKDKFKCPQKQTRIRTHTRKDSPVDRHARQECAVLEALSKGNLGTTELGSTTGIPLSTLYATLRRLRGMVRKQEDGTWTLLEVGQEED